MKIDTVMDMVIGGFQNIISKTQTIKNLEEELSKLKISGLVIKDKETRFELTIVFIENKTEKVEKVEIGFVPRKIELQNENKKIDSIHFSEVNFKNSNYYSTVKVHLH